MAGPGQARPGRPAPVVGRAEVHGQAAVKHHLCGSPAGGGVPRQHQAEGGALVHPHRLPVAQLPGAALAGALHEGVALAGQALSDVVPQALPRRAVLCAVAAADVGGQDGAVVKGHLGGDVGAVAVEGHLRRGRGRSRGACLTSSTHHSSSCLTHAHGPALPFGRDATAQNSSPFATFFVHSACMQSKI